MISFLCDGINVPWFFNRILRKMDPKDVGVIYIPTFDYQNELGIHFSPGFVSLVNELARKKFRPSRVVLRMLSRLGMITEDMRDFDIVIDLLITLWMARGKSVVDIFDIISKRLGSKHCIIPLVEPLTTTIVKCDKEAVKPMNMHDIETEIKEIEFIPKDVEMCGIAREIIDTSDKLVLVCISPLSFLYIKRMGKLGDIFKKFKGQIIYVLPNKLSSIDHSILRFLDSDPSLLGLIGMLNDSVDTIVFSEDKTEILEKMHELKFMCYPLKLESEDPNEKRRIINQILKLLQT